MGNVLFNIMYIIKQLLFKYTTIQNKPLQSIIGLHLTLNTTEILSWLVGALKSIYDTFLDMVWFAPILR